MFDKNRLNAIWIRKTRRNGWWRDDGECFIFKAIIREQENEKFWVLNFCGMSNLSAARSLARDTFNYSFEDTDEVKEYKVNAHSSPRQ